MTCKGHGVLGCSFIFQVFFCHFTILVQYATVKRWQKIKGENSYRHVTKVPWLDVNQFMVGALNPSPTKRRPPDILCDILRFARSQ